jgi:hypothetical protein
MFEIRIAELTDVPLAGQALGQKLLGQVIAGLHRPSAPALYYIDFEGVTFATASFLRAFALGLRDFVLAQVPDLYPVVANATSAIIEDLLLALNARADVMVVCELDSGGQARNARVIGSLEPKQADALKAVSQLGKVDAATLHRNTGAHPHGTPTVWNNRLAALAAKGLLIEENQGRSKLYRAVLPELSYGL